MSQRVISNNLVRRISQLEYQHGSLREAARAVGLSVSYLTRLANGQRPNPSDEALRKLGLQRVVSYEALTCKTGAKLV